MRTSGDPLVAMLEELVALSDPIVGARAGGLVGRLAAGDLRVALVGEAKRGKSSLGNAMLGEEVLPTAVIPVTSISTEVRTGSPRRQQGLLREASGDLHAAALEHLGVRLRGDVPVLKEPDLPAFRYDFEPEVGWNHAWVSGARTRVPVRIGRRRVENYVRGEATRIVDKHLGCARAECQARLENARRLLQAQVAAAFADLTDGLRTGQQAAVEIRTQSAPGQERERRRLSDQRRALVELADALRELAELRDHTLSSARTEQSPTGVRSTRTEEERH